jgi:colanic acid/amylovoran biosynthesis glycosyltransferase
VKNLLSRAAIFVAPSIITAEGEMDGIPNVLLEAMACQKPVVASAIPPIVEVIEDGVNGYVVPERDVKKLAEKIQLLLLDEKMRRQMGEAGRKKVEAQFELAKNVSGFLSLLSEYSTFNRGKIDI